MKQCSRCGEEKPKAEFPVRNKAKGTVFAACKQCTRLQQDHWRHANKEVVNKKALARNVGLTLDQYNALDLSSCAVCRGQLNSTTNKAFLDHDHATGLFRGVLCRGCNSALGFARDNPETLRALALYLEGR